MILKIDGVECCSVFVAESEFNITWHGDFSTWEELHNDSEVVKLVNVAKMKLKRPGGKGKGKIKLSIVAPQYNASMA